jgi:predicted alpha/beta hydrolase
VGHSAGGQLFGLHTGPEVAGALLVGAQSGHWRHWSGLARLGMAALWHVGLPALVPLVGYLPMRAFRQGEDVPAGVALEWARWGRHREYILAHRPPAGAAFSAHRGPVRLYAVLDDAYAPPRSVEALARMFRGTAAEVRRLAPADAGVARLGHFAFFRPRFEATLWAEALAWLRERAGAAADTAAAAPGARVAE